MKSKSLFSLALIVVFSIILIVGLSRRAFVDANLLRAQSAKLFSQVQESDGSIRYVNQFHLHIRNQSDQAHHIKVEGDVPDVTITIPENPFLLKPGQDLNLPVFIKFPAGVLDTMGTKDLTIKITSEDIDNGGVTVHTRLLGELK